MSDDPVATAAQLAEGVRRLAQVGVTTACFVGQHDTCSRRPGCGCECHVSRETVTVPLDRPAH